LYKPFIFQCISNGINYEKLQKGSAKNIIRLEMFFSGFPRICGMELFPDLQYLCLIGQEIEVLENFESLTNLTELYVCECAVKVGKKVYIQAVLV
jgi:hypothetical protein